ncbi:MAG: hypothetical protein E7578_08750 [Ruminococcaceae bacterium]|nr:hypothetical protein [Oscillospiraceae bacterium]
MNKIVKYTLTVAVALTFIITIIASVFSYIAMTQSFDHTLGYFDVGSVAAATALYLPLAVPVIAVIACIIIRKKVSFKDSPAAGIPTVFTSVLTGLLMIAGAYFTFSGEGALTKLDIGIIITAVISAVYFILLPFFGSKSFMLFLSFAPALWAAFRLLDEYFRVGAPINSPIRTINLTMFAFLLLFFAEEIRFGIDKQSVGGYYFFILSAIAFTGCATFPKLIIIFTNNADFNFGFIEWCLGAAVFMFLLARLAALPAIIEDKSDSTADIAADEICTDEADHLTEDPVSDASVISETSDNSESDEDQ